MHTHQHWLVFLPFSLDESQVLQPVALLTEGHQPEMAVVRRHIHLFAHLDERFLPQPVGNQVLDGDDLHAEALGNLLELRHAGHGAVVVDNLNQGSGGL